MKAQLTQTLISGFLLAVVAVLVFSPSFVGTLREVAVILFWGFTTDIGVGVLLEKVKTGGLNAPVK